jgi:hypothetical protein
VYHWYRRRLTTKVVEEFGSPETETLAGVKHLQGTQETTSENHPDWSTSSASGEDVGGHFITKRQYALCPVGQAHIDTGWVNPDINYERRYVYDGPIMLDEVAIPSKTPFPPYANSSDAALDAFGTTAIARCAPTQPTANLATALLEVYREGLPKMIGKDLWQENTQKAMDLKRNASSASGEFLNVEFGWLPLVADVQDFVKAVRTMDKRLLQFVRDNGKPVRRRFEFPPESSVSETVVTANAVPRLGSNGANYLNFTATPRPQVLRRRETTINRWFSGAFVYHLKDTYIREIYAGHVDKFQIYRKIFGTDLTPEVIWELAPWSWAVDWFSNVGDVISNASMWSSNGLVLKYGYIMEHSVVRDTYTFVGPTHIRGGSTARPPDIYLHSEVKMRRRATPFGFGLSMGGLTTLQKSILAAVGLSRLK